VSNPFAIFEQWYMAAEEAKIIEPNAMVLSTVDSDHRPHSRVVLFKRFHEEVLYFFTNYNSEKSKQLEKNPYAALNFHWREPAHRQIRIEGKITKASEQISDDYFATRGRGSQIGAWSSPQSQPIKSREELEKLVEENEKRFAGKNVPRPPFWGGWGLVATKFEFWEAGENRLHTRMVYEKIGDSWESGLLGP
jgi:pyridoxamine 5'-phosphate oxidase